LWTTLTRDLIASDSGRSTPAGRSLGMACRWSYAVQRVTFISSCVRRSATPRAISPARPAQTRRGGPLGSRPEARSDGRVAPTVVDEAVNGVPFKAYVRQQLVPTPGKGGVLVRARLTVELRI
jgi:hypothetical protein